MNGRGSRTNFNIFDMNDRDGCRWAEGSWLSVTLDAVCSLGPGNGPIRVAGITAWSDTGGGFRRVTDIGDLPLPESVVSAYRDRGITSLFPPQREAVDAGLLSGVDIVAAVPTASGKTLLAELGMLSSDGLALYVVPLRALAHEKARTFAALPDTEVVVTTGDVTSDVSSVGDADIVVATSEKINAVLRTGPDWVSRLDCVVIDEFHLLGDDERGPTLEMTVASLRAVVPSIQTIALSATVANADVLADWLGAHLVDTEWRPVELRRGIAVDDAIRFEDGAQVQIESAVGESVTARLVDAATSGDGQCLVFVHSRRAAESLADDLAGIEVGSAVSVEAEIRGTARTSTGEDLADAVGHGVGFHHAGLRHTHRTMIEDAFRSGALDVVCATPTLAAGVNLPARRVVVRDHRRYTGDGWSPLPVLDVHQMFGRAGRPGLDPVGEAVLVADSREDGRTLRDRYLDGVPEPVTSSLATQDALRTHVLGAVAGGIAPTRSALLDVLGGTFYAFQADEGTLVDVADLVLDDLVGEDLLARDDGLAVTGLGRVVAEQFIDPHTGSAFVTKLASLPDVSGVTRRTILEIACATSAVEGFYLGSDDHGPTHRYARRHAAEFVTDPQSLGMEYAEWLRAVKTTQVFADYLDGASEASLTDDHGIGPGDLRVTGERLTWVVGALAAVADHVDSEYTEEIRVVRDGLDDRIQPTGP